MGVLGEWLEAGHVNGDGTFMGHAWRRVCPLVLGTGGTLACE